MHRRDKWIHQSFAETLLGLIWRFPIARIIVEKGHGRHAFLSQNDIGAAFFFQYTSAQLLYSNIEKLHDSSQRTRSHFLKAVLGEKRGPGEVLPIGFNVLSNQSINYSGTVQLIEPVPIGSILGRKFVIENVRKASGIVNPEKN